MWRLAMGVQCPCSITFIADRRNAAMLEESKVEPIVMVMRKGK